jgi:pyruvate dehydrogenase E2 component (dihydrolipoamide acetyltransferase)
MPKLSPTMEEGQIARWTKNEGDDFDAGETLAEVDTDKATMEMTALTGGTLLKILKGAGDTALLGETIAITGQKGEDISALLKEIASSAPAKSEPPASAGGQSEKQEAAAPEPKAETRAVASVPQQQPAPAAQPAITTNGGGRLVVSPIAARMAAENGLDLKTVSGTGPNGRIIKRDVETALAGGGQQDEGRSTQFTPSRVVGASPFRDEPTSQMRRVIATRLAESIGPIPTFYLTVEIEMDNALALRKSINASISEEQKVSVNDIIVKAAAMALKKHPFVNASYQDRNIRFYGQADIGVAVAIEDGLITPVVRGADLKGVVEISAEIKALAAKAKAKKLQPEEYTGATFSISNLGMFGIKEFTAIINPPEAGIIAVGGAEQVPVVRDGEIVVRSIMHVTMSCDHRVVDGATGAKFLQTFKQNLEQPGMMLA